MRRRTWITGFVGALIIGGALGNASRNAAAQSSAFECSDRTVEGTYGAQVQGTRPVPGNPGAGIESFNGVVIRTYDGAGSFTQIDNVKGCDRRDRARPSGVRHLPGATELHDGGAAATGARRSDRGTACDPP